MHNDLISQIEELDPLSKYQLLGQLHGPLLAMWVAMDRMDWSALGRAMDELDRRAGIALLDLR